jgi:parvulin-like peptidyl-prolyl isomerase
MAWNARARLGGLVTAFALMVFLLSVPMPSRAEQAQVLVTVNDLPVTSFDVRQRIALWQLVSGKKTAMTKKEALESLVDDIAEIEAAKKRGAAASEAEIDQRMEAIAKSLKTDSKGLKAKLKSQGISVAAMRQYVAAQFAFHRLLRVEGKGNVKVSDAEVNARLAEYRNDINRKIDQQIAKIEADPRRRPVTVYQIMEISFPIDGDITPQLLQSRAMEVNQFLGRFKGCKSARAAASGIFNVKVSKQLEADAAKFPKQLKQALDQVKPGNAIGPIRSKDGLQALAFCGVRKVVPPKIERPKDIAYPTANQVRGQLEQEKLDRLEEQYRGAWRKGLLIEYRDPPVGQ